ncbi:MAG TPA: hypothetical protein VMB27_02780 [Solirubrobacteraceae bacterium]|nr:hypothetical protein [Solirubrobacteraceae bacterium]
MSYSTLAAAAIALGLLAAGVALTAGVLLCFGRRGLAQRTLPVLLGVLAGVIVLAFAAVAESENDLEAHAERTLGLASAAERTEMAQTGRYTTSLRRLERVDRAFASDVKVNQPVVRLTTGPDDGDVTLRVSLGPGTRAQATLDADGRLEDISTPAARSSSRRRLVLGISGRRTS